MLDLALQLIVNGLLVGAIYALMALGMMVILGILRIINMAQGELYMLGGYFCNLAMTQLGFSYFPAIVFAMLATGCVGVLMDRVVIRPFQRRPFYIVFLSTFAVSMMLQNAAALIWGPDPLTVPSPFSVIPIVIGPIFITTQKLFIFAVALITVAAFAAFLRYTRIGMAIRALARDRDAALLMGIDADRIQSITVGLGAALAAAAGALIGTMFSIYPTMGQLPLLKGFALVVMAGMGSVGGVFVAGLMLGVAEGLTAGFLSADYVDLVAFTTMLMVLMIKPEGLSSWGKSVV
jgi:branched-chain amino acid transport system permease protein